MLALAGEPIGFYSAPMKQIARELQASSHSFDSSHLFSWIELSEPMVNVLVSIVIISLLIMDPFMKGIIYAFCSREMNAFQRIYNFLEGRKMV